MLKEELASQGLTIRNYKEPLKAIPKGEGFGYYGTIINTLDNDALQCHVCGQLCSNLAVHARSAHKLSAVEYRERFDLTFQTALVSESERQRLKERTLAWLKTLTPQQIEAYRAKGRAMAMETHKGRKVQPTIRLETKNIRGTCPDQLLEHIKVVAQAVGHTPSRVDIINHDESQRFVHLIRKTFGSYTNALKLLSMQPQSKQKTSSGGTTRYTDEELLEYLRIYAQENQKIPTATDCKRRLIPGDDTYIRRFGSLERARQEAGVYEILGIKDSSMLRSKKKMAA